MFHGTQHKGDNVIPYLLFLLGFLILSGFIVGILRICEDIQFKKIEKNKK